VQDQVSGNSKDEKKDPIYFIGTLVIGFSTQEIFVFQEFEYFSSYLIFTKGCEMIIREAKTYLINLNTLLPG